MTDDLIHVLNSYAITRIDRSQFSVARIHEIFKKKNENNNAIQRIYIGQNLSTYFRYYFLNSSLKILPHGYLSKKYTFISWEKIHIVESKELMNST